MDPRPATGMHGPLVSHELTSVLDNSEQILS